MDVHPRTVVVLDNSPGAGALAQRLSFKIDDTATATTDRSLWSCVLEAGAE